MVGQASGHNSKLDEAIATKLIYNQRETIMYTIVILKVAAVTRRIRDNEQVFVKLFDISIEY